MHAASPWDRAPARLRLGWIILIVTCAAFPVSRASALPLWELTGTKGHVQLLGSIHFLRPADYPLPAGITAALEHADVLVMELDTDDLDPAVTATVVAELARDGKGRDLQTLLGPKAYGAASAEAHELGIDLGQLAPFEPWYAAIVVTQLRLQQLGFDPDFGIEAQMTATAKQKGKTIRGLESVRQQLASLDSLSPAAQAEFLQSTLEEAATIDDEVDKVLRAWKAGDARTLEKDLLKGVEDQPELYRHLVLDRNRNFSRDIAALAAEPGNYLVVVGALHLVGPDSVLRMLENAGYKVRQIP